MQRRKLLLVGSLYVLFVFFIITLPWIALLNAAFDSAFSEFLFIIVLYTKFIYMQIENANGLKGKQ